MHKGKSCQLNAPPGKAKKGQMKRKSYTKGKQNGKSNYGV